MTAVNQATIGHSSTAPRRNTGTRERALTAAVEILRRDGYSRLTMERLAEQSGVAKTTLYRRWRGKAALCVDLYLEVAKRELKDPDTGDVYKDLMYLFCAVVHLQTQTVAGPAFIGLIADALSNPASNADLLADFARRRRGITRSILKRAIERGEIAPQTDVDVVIDALGGATTFRLLQGHAPLSRAFADALIKLVLLGCRAPQSRRAGR